MNNSKTPQIKTVLGKPWLRNSAGLVVGIFLLFGLLGYFWLPGYAKQKLQEQLSQKLHRAVTIQEIDVSPYALKLGVRGLTIGNLPEYESAKPLLAIDELFVDLSVMSVARRAPVISEVRLTGPKIYLERGNDGRYSISDLLEEWANAPADEDSASPRFSVSNIQISGGQVDFVDRPRDSHQEITELKLDIPFLANFASSEPVWVEPRFSAKVNGAAFALEGKALPFADRREAALTLKFDNLDLTRIDEYSPVPLKIKLVSLKVDSDLKLTFVQTADAASEIKLSGNVRLHDLDAQDAKTGHRFLVVKTLDLALGNLDVVQRSARVDKLAIEGLDGDILRRKDGNLELTALLTGGAAPQRTRDPSTGAARVKIGAAREAAAEAGWKVGIGETSLVDWRLRYRDNAALRPFVATISKINGAVRNYELGSDVPVLADLQLSDIDVQRAADKVPLLKIPSASITGLSLILPKRNITIGAVEIDSPSLAVTREPDGDLDFQRLFAAPSATNAEVAKSPEWKTRIKLYSIRDGAINFIDQTLASPLPLVATSVEFKLADANHDATGQSQLELSAKVNKRGQLKASGIVKTSPFAADLKLALKEVDLVPLQGWAGNRLNALVTRGAISFDGKVKVDGTPAGVEVQGDGRLTDLNLLDQNSATDLLRVRSLDVGGISVNTQPLRVELASIALSDFFAQIVISATGQLNLKGLVRSDQVGDGANTAPAHRDAASLPKSESVAKGSAPVKLGRITLQGGRINFTDNFIKPNYIANLTGLDGRIGPLEAGKLGEVDIRGSVDTGAPLEIAGMVDPFSNPIALDIGAKAKGIDLPTFSPYSGKYIGYGIEKGKLSMDVKYRIDRGELTAENHIFIDQLTFSDKASGADAPSFPVKLAVALLKNSRGEIDINLPVSGSINDPEFSLGGLIWQVIGNLVVKAVTSPFALLGSLFGGGDELSEIEFSPGRARLEPEAEKRMQSLAKALQDRPGLSLEITGRADPSSDKEGLKRAVLERRVKTQKLAEITKRGDAGGSLADIQISDAEYPKYLTLAYENESFPKPKNMIGLNKTLPVPEMEQLMLANIDAGPNEMRELAERRALAAQDWLVKSGGIPAARVYVLAPKVEPVTDVKKTGNRADFSLK
ncbi:MAG: DUF748 domain-containing protein [Rhodocyclaceae bacterium]|nr:DUF748 domain-containing protein [Rhodocyclaceae bacterium]